MWIFSIGNGGPNLALEKDRKSPEQERTGIRGKLVKLEQEKMDLNTEKMGTESLLILLWPYFHKPSTGFPQAQEIMESLENHENSSMYRKSWNLKHPESSWKNLGILWNNLTKLPVARKLAVRHQYLCVWQLVFWLLVVSSFNYFKIHT